MSIIRAFGPWGRSLVEFYTSRRFKNIEEIKLVEDYLYHICAQPGSGEFALGRLLLPGAWARIPLHHRLPRLTMPTTFIYGNEDWMDYRGAMRAAYGMRPDTRVSVVYGADHHIQLDNPTGFNNVMIAEMLSNIKPGPYSIPEVEYTFIRN
eukprot:jgi/Hompol1/3860/HPOL_006792-RA